MKTYPRMVLRFDTFSYSSRDCALTLSVLDIPANSDISLLQSTERIPIERTTTRYCGTYTRLKLCRTFRLRRLSPNHGIWAIIYNVTLMSPTIDAFTIPRSILKKIAKCHPDVITHFAVPLTVAEVSAAHCLIRFPDMSVRRFLQVPKYARYSRIGLKVSK